MDFRWIDGPTASQEDWDTIESVLASRGWMSLNRPTSRILVAEKDGVLRGFICLQLVPHSDPLYVDRKERGTGLAEELADRMLTFLTLPSTAVAANCPPPAPGVTIYCKAADKYQISGGGAPYVVIWPMGGAPGTVKSVNTILPDASGNVTVPIPTKAVVAAQTAPLQ